MWCRSQDPIDFDSFLSLSSVTTLHPTTLDGIVVYFSLSSLASWRVLFSHYPCEYRFHRLLFVFTCFYSIFPLPSSATSGVGITRTDHYSLKDASSTSFSPHTLRESDAGPEIFLMLGFRSSLLLFSKSLRCVLGLFSHWSWFTRPSIYDPVN
jgi:hypothetical protein